MEQRRETITQRMTLRGREISHMEPIIPLYITRGLTLNHASMLPLTRTTIEEPHAMSITVTAPPEIMNSFKEEVARAREASIPTRASITVISQEEYDLIAPAFQAIFGEKLKRPRMGVPRTTTVNSNGNLDRRFGELLESLGAAAEQERSLHELQEEQEEWLARESEKKSQERAESDE